MGQTRLDLAKPWQLMSSLINQNSTCKKKSELRRSIASSWDSWPTLVLGLEQSMLLEPRTCGQPSKSIPH